MAKRISELFRDTTSQVIVGCVLAIVVVVMLEASVLYDDDCSRRGWDVHHSTGVSGESRITVGRGRCRLDAEVRGEVELSPDERGLQRLGPGAYFEIGERFLDGRRRVEARPGAGGEPELRWFVDRRQVAADAEAREWLRAALERLFRVSGFDAEARVGRLLAAGGLASALAEIPEVSGDHVQALYLRHISDQAEMDPAGLAEWLDAAGRYVSSDFELGRLLSGLPESTAAMAGLSAAGPGGDRARAAYVDAARSIGSDFELRRSLSALIESGELPPEALVAALDAAGDIGSDFELARFLVLLAERHPITPDLRPDFERTAANLGSEHERRRVAEAVAASPG